MDEPPTPGTDLRADHGAGPNPPPRSPVLIIIAVGAVAAVVWVAVLLATLFGSMSFYHAVTGPPSPWDGLTLTPGSWEAGSVDVTLAGTFPATMPVTNLTFIVTTGNFTLYFNGRSGETQAVNGTSVTVTFTDSDGNGFASPGDSIEVAVRPAGAATTLHGGVLRVYGTDGAWLMSVGLPSA